MAPSVAMSIVNPLAGNAAMFASVYGNDFSQAKEEGKSNREAHAFALMDAGLEIGMNLVGGRLAGGVARLAGKKSLAKDTIKQLVKNPALQRTLGLLTDMNAEGAEEYMQLVLQPWIRNIAYGEHNEIDWAPDGGLKTYLMGALTAGVFNGAGYSLGLSKDAKTSRLNMTYDGGRLVPFDTAVRTLEGIATNEDIDIMQRYGAEVGKTGVEAKLDELTKTLNVKMGSKSYGQILRDTKNMNVFEKTQYYAELITDPAYQADMQGYIQTAKTKAMAAAKADVVRKAAEQYGKKSGYEVQFESMDEGIGGRIDKANKVITLNKDSDKGLMFVLSHEMVHDTESSTHYSEMETATEAHLASENKTMAEEAAKVKETYAAKDIVLDDKGAKQEVVAKFIESKVMGNESDIFKFVFQSPRLASRVFGRIQRMVNHIGADKADKALMNAKNGFEKALQGTQQNKNSDLGTAGSVAEFQFSVDKSFSDYVGKATQKNDDSFIFIENKTEQDNIIERIFKEKIQTGDVVKIPNEILEKYADIGGDAKKSLIADIKTYYDEHYQGRSVECDINGNMIEVYFHNDGKKKSVGWRMKPDKAATFEFLDQLFGSASYVFSEVNRDQTEINQIPRFHYLIAVANIDNQNIPVKIFIRDFILRKKTESKYYTHNLLTQKANDGNYSPVEESAKGADIIDSNAYVSINNNITQNDADVNIQSGSESDINGATQDENVLQEKKRPRIIEAIRYITGQIKWADIQPSWPLGENPIGELEDSKDRGIQRQNETMHLLASLGYKVVALKVILGGNGFGLSEKSNPDCLVEDHVFEIYAPEGDPKIDNVINKISDKSTEQAPNILLNLNDYQGDVNVLISNIKRRRKPNDKLKNLGILLVILDGKIIDVFE